MSPVHPHEPLGEWLGRLLGPRRPVEFEPSDDRVLTAFAALIAGSDPGPVVQGVLDGGGSGYRFLELDRPAVSAADPRP